MIAMLKIVTWNVNSLRVRLPQVLAWLEQAKPDVLALQETKMPDEEFPFAELQKAGYHVLFSGQKKYNGVALLSCQPLSEIVVDMPFYADPQRRLIAATLNDIRIVNLYVPNGQSVGSEKYAYKLAWLENLHALLHEELKKYPKIIVLGDMNIAPADIDVYDPQRWVGEVLVSEPERRAFQRILQLGFQDCFRLHTPDLKEFSWWDYRLYAFQRNWGLRIDHILASTALATYNTACIIDQEPRKAERPSDHTPVIAEFTGLL
jgi:exodeoxyribonuclease-3